MCVRICFEGCGDILLYALLGNRISVYRNRKPYPDFPIVKSVLPFHLATSRKHADMLADFTPKYVLSKDQKHKFKICRLPKNKQIHACRHAQLKSLGGKPIIWRNHESFVSVLLIKRARSHLKSLYLTWPHLHPPEPSLSRKNCCFQHPWLPPSVSWESLGSAEPQRLCICWVSAPARPGMSQHPTPCCCTWQKREMLPRRHTGDFTHR